MRIPDLNLPTWLVVYFCVLVFAACAFMGFAITKHIQEDHDYYETGDHICVRGLGYYPGLMSEPSNFLVCGDIVVLGNSGSPL